MQQLMPPQASANGMGDMPPQAATNGGIFGPSMAGIGDDMPPQASANGMGMPPQASANGMGMPPQASANGFGASPDGIGAYMSDPGGNPIPMQQTMHYWPQQPGVGAELAFLEPQDTSGKAALQSAGFTALLVAITTGIGFAWGKGWGAVSGLTIGAGIMNGYRAQKWMNDPDPRARHEAIVSATVGVGEAVIAGYAIWKAAKARKR
jgi:hypothetical protein